jgi:hypothetical protein
VRPAGITDRDQHRSAVGRGEQPQRQALRVQRRVVLLLPAVQGQRLAEVTGPVEQPDADQRHAEVGRRLEVVAGQHAEAAGVVRQHLAHAELHREVADRGRQVGVGGLLTLVPARFGQVGVQVGGLRVDLVDQVVVPGQLAEPLGGHLPEQPDGVIAHPRPGRRVDRREQVLGRRVPAPAEVAGQFLQGRERFRQLGADSEPTECSHVPQRT